MGGELSMSEPPHVVVLGAGFAGLGALQKLRKAPVRVTLVDRNDYHTFQPLLYQVATRQLSPERISSSVEGLLDRGPSFLQANVTQVNLAARSVSIEGGEELSYDYLLVALGAGVNFFGTTGAAENAIPLYTLEDANRLKAHIDACFEGAIGDPQQIDDGALTFCIVGGGATGVEVAGAMTELIEEERREAGSALREMAGEVHIFEMQSSLLTSFKQHLRDHTKTVLEQHGVGVHLGEAVTGVTPTRLLLRSGREVKTHTVVWAAGVQASPVAQSLGTYEGNRPGTEPDLSLPGHPEVFVAGDIGRIVDDKSGAPLPQMGSVAQQSGQRAGENIALAARGRSTRPFRYTDKGTMAMIGRGEAIVQLRSGRTLTGKPAWLAWKAVHLMLLKGGEQKARTLLEWAA
jgi:NADH dehydrogenase